MNEIFLIQTDFQTWYWNLQLIWSSDFTEPKCLLVYSKKTNYTSIQTVTLWCKRGCITMVKELIFRSQTICDESHLSIISHMESLKFFFYHCWLSYTYKILFVYSLPIPQYCMLIPIHLKWKGSQQNARRVQFWIIKNISLDKSK